MSKLGRSMLKLEICACLRLRRYFLGGSKDIWCTLAQMHQTAMYTNSIISKSGHGG